MQVFSIIQYILSILRYHASTMYNKDRYSIFLRVMGVLHCYMIASSSNCIKRAKKSLIHTLITEHSKLDALHVSMNGVYYLVSYIHNCSMSSLSQVTASNMHNALVRVCMQLVQHFHKFTMEVNTFDEFDHPVTLLYVATEGQPVFN